MFSLLDGVILFNWEDEWSADDTMGTGWCHYGGDCIWCLINTSCHAPVLLFIQVKYLHHTILISSSLVGVLYFLYQLTSSPLPHVTHSHHACMHMYMHMHVYTCCGWRISWHCIISSQLYSLFFWIGSEYVRSCVSYDSLVLFPWWPLHTKWSRIVFIITQLKSNLSRVAVVALEVRIVVHCHRTCAVKLSCYWLGGNCILLQPN